MEQLKDFLESSTVHGLVYISTTKRLVKLLWIVIVLFGFSTAGYLIYESFQAWEESPISTTIETLPISDIIFPKVTVCPPKNTYTDLNYDLMMVENMTLVPEERNEMINYALKLMEDHHYQNLMTNLSVLEEKNRYYNWYHGYTRMDLPYMGRPSICKYYEGRNRPECRTPKLTYNMKTYATSGTISTKSFGEKFDPEKIIPELKYTITFQTPLRRSDNTEVPPDENVTVYFNIVRHTMEVFESFYDDDGELPSATKKISPPRYNNEFFFERTISVDEINELTLNLMPGFNISWYYSEELQPDQIDLYDDSYYDSHNQFSRSQN